MVSSGTVPTIEEQLDSHVQLAVRMHSQTCWQCDGVGRCPAMDAPSEKLVLEDGRTAYAYPNMDCPNCEARGVCVPEFLDPRILSNVQSAAIGMAVGAREKQDFDGMNRALDWAMKFIAGSVAAAGYTMADAVAFTQNAIVNSPIDDIRPVAVASGDALSHAELVDLGVVEDDGEG